MQTPAHAGPTAAGGIAPQDRTAFPAEAVEWLVGAAPRTVVALAHRDLATALAASGHDVAAVPSRDVLPFPSQLIDVVVAAEELPGDLDALADLLRPGGRLTLVCNQRDHRVPWARRLDTLLGASARSAAAEHLAASDRFGAVEERSFRYWQVVDPESLAALVRSELAALDADEREQRVRSALELYADYGRGRDGMQLPWVSRCFRATVGDPLGASRDQRPARRTEGSTEPAEGVLLIDFR